MFLDSVIQQDADEVQRLLALGVDVNYTNTDGISALHQVFIVHFLLVIVIVNLFLRFLLVIFIVYFLLGKCICRSGI